MRAREVSANTFVGRCGPPAFRSAGSGVIRKGSRRKTVTMMGFAPALKVLVTLTKPAGGGVALSHVEKKRGSFDVVLVCSILEHLSDQVRALASAARVAADTIVITTPLIETTEKIARFEGDAARPEVDYVWWLYSIPVYREVLAMLGFTIERIEKKAFLFENAGRRDVRHIIVARRQRESPAR